MIVYFTTTGISREKAHGFVEVEYIARHILEKGKHIPKAKEYIVIIIDGEIVGVLGIIKEKDGKLPFMESFSGITVEKNSIEFGRFAIKRMIPIEEKIKIGLALFNAAYNWHVIMSKMTGQEIHCYMETQDYVVDFFHKTTGKKIFMLQKNAIFNGNKNELSENSLGFISKSQIFKADPVAAAACEAPAARKIA